MSKSPSSEVMDIGNIMNNKGAAAAAANGDMKPQMGGLQQLPHPSLGGAGIDRTNSPHGSESSYHSGPRPGPLDALNGMGQPRPYGSPSMQAHMTMPGDPNLQPGIMIPPMPHMGQGMPGQYHHQPQPEAPQPPPKAYPCSTCGKGFARRSDLARHERIHSGIRPHVCDWPDCGKQFIQRSALTVHQRVHTGEKPHVCERCSKPFSDSSSLARHRRIHSGKRPYQCPYAYCQKTFTRRTTLTRHQGQHHGTVEDSKNWVQKALASTRAGEPNSDVKSAHASPLNTPSPTQRHMSASPNTELAAANNAIRQNEFAYMNNGSLPVHMRTDLQPGQSPTSAPIPNNGMRPTSHPTTFAPPPTLEPSVESHVSGPGSAGGSPHMGSVGWQSPSHMPSPTHSNSGSYVYPDPDGFPSAGNTLGQMYYGAANQIRRPNSTEPGSGAYDVKPRHNELWAGAQ